MTTYTEPGEKEITLLNDTLKRHHQRLSEAGVTVNILMAHAEVDGDGDPKGDALKHHGVAALAVTRAFPLKLRAHGLADAEIILDGDRWGNLDKRTKAAVLDHELTHLGLVHKENVLVLDDLGRPKITLRHHDYDFGWFIEVVERHGAASIEHAQAKRFSEESGQLFLNFEL